MFAPNCRPHLQRAVFARRYQLRLVGTDVDRLPTYARDEGSVALESLALELASCGVP